MPSTNYAATLAAVKDRASGWETTWSNYFQTLTGDEQQTLLPLVMKSGVSAQIGAPVIYATDGAITLTDGKVVLTKAGVAAMTLAAPTAAQDGLELLITSGSSNAHVITGTNLFWAGQTGGPFNKITLAAFIGASAKVMAYNLLWHVTSHSPGAATVGD